jgi:hypothetical protein
VRDWIGHGRIAPIVDVAVVFVVHVRVRVLQQLVVVLVLVPLRQVKPDAERHQRGPGEEERRRTLVK